jgi:hypothetical protein
MKLRGDLVGVTLAIVLGVAALSGTAHADSNRPTVPVVVGHDGPDYDACASSGTVERLDPHGDGFLAVRAGPSSSYATIGKLYNAKDIIICDEKGDWYGIVYAPGRDIGICNVTTPWHRPMPYTGPCRSGWVHKKWIGNLAG